MYIYNTDMLLNLEPVYNVYNVHEPFGLGRFATDRCYAPQVNGRYAALLLTNFYFS